MKKPSQDTLIMLEVLRTAVRKALDRKKRLGQYAVVWVDNKITYLGDNPPAEQTPAPSDQAEQ